MRRAEDIRRAFSRIAPDGDMCERMIKAMEDRKMNGKIIRKGKFLAAAAAIAAVIGVTTAFAASPTGQEAISNIMEYFRNEQSTRLTSLEELAKYNEEIGASVTHDGITLTLDNVAADDNFVHVFYTVTSETPFYEGDDPYTNAAWDRLLWVECCINGEQAGLDSNNNSSDSYFADAHTYKAVRKYNISADEIPDNFKVELFGERNALLKGDLPEDSAFNLLLQDRIAEITDEQKAAAWYVRADVDKSAAQVETVTRNIGVALDGGGIIDKAVFSPFGNQIIVRTAPNENTDWDGDLYTLGKVDDFALFDENGTCLDILNTGMVMEGDGSSVNSLEFLKADVNTKKLTIVPTRYIKRGENDTEAIEINKKTGAYPMTFEGSDGKAVVTDVRIYDGRVEIDYYIDGFMKYGPYFELLNDAGENVEPGGKLGCVLTTKVNYDDNSYTAVYRYDARDENGSPIPADESVSAEAIKANFTTIGFFCVNNITLDWDKAVTVDLK